MPAWLLAEYIDSMERIVAAESLRSVTVHAVAGGSVKQHEARSIIRRWERQASRGQQNRDQPLETVAAMHGIPVRDV